MPPIIEIGVQAVSRLSKGSSTQTGVPFSPKSLHVGTRQVKSSSCSPNMAIGMQAGIKHGMKGTARGWASPTRPTPIVACRKSPEPTRLVTSRPLIARKDPGCS